MCQMNTGTYGIKKLYKSALGVLCLIMLIFPPVGSADDTQLVVVISSSRYEYEQASRAFLNTVAENAENIVTEKRLFLPGPGGEGAFWASIGESTPALIITVGTPSTESALKYVKDTPLVCTMVLGGFNSFVPFPYPADSIPEFSGVTLSIPFQKQLELLRDALPTVRRVGLLFTNASSKDQHSAGEIARKLGLRLIEARIDSDRDVPRALRSILSDIEVLWIPPDIQIYRRDALNFILEECYRKNVPVMAYSKQLAVAGAALAMDIDYQDIGRQTADLVLGKLSRKQLALNRIETPRTVLLYINEKVALGLGLHIPRKVSSSSFIVGREDRQK